MADAALDSKDDQSSQGLSAILSDMLSLPTGSPGKAEFMRMLDAAVSAAQQDACSDPGLVKQLCRARDLYPVDADAARKLIVDISDAEVLLTLGSGLALPVGGPPQQQQWMADARPPATRGQPQHQHQQIHGPHGSTYAYVGEAAVHTDQAQQPAWMRGWQGCLYRLLLAASSNTDSLPAMRKRLAEAVRLLQQHPLARATLLPVELQRVYNRARFVNELVSGVHDLLSQFAKPLYHTCRSCGARRLALHDPVPPPGRFSCGHMACLFAARECKQGGWDESREWRELFPLELLQLASSQAPPAPAPAPASGPSSLAHVGPALEAPPSPDSPRHVGCAPKMVRRPRYRPAPMGQQPSGSGRSRSGWSDVMVSDDQTNDASDTDRRGSGSGIPHKRHADSGGVDIGDISLKAMRREGQRAPSPSSGRALANAPAPAPIIKLGMEWPRQTGAAVASSTMLQPPPARQSASTGSDHLLPTLDLGNTRQPATVLSREHGPTMSGGAHSSLLLVQQAGLQHQPDLPVSSGARHPVEFPHPHSAAVLADSGMEGALSAAVTAQQQQHPESEVIFPSAGTLVRTASGRLQFIAAAGSTAERSATAPMAAATSRDAVANADAGVLHLLQASAPQLHSPPAPSPQQQQLVMLPDGRLAVASLQPLPIAVPLQPLPKAVAPCLDLSSQRMLDKASPLKSFLAATAAPGTAAAAAFGRDSSATAAAGRSMSSAEAGNRPLVARSSGGDEPAPPGGPSIGTAGPSLRSQPLARPSDGAARISIATLGGRPAVVGYVESASGHTCQVLLEPLGLASDQAKELGLDPQGLPVVQVGVPPSGAAPAQRGTSSAGGQRSASAALHLSPLAGVSQHMQGHASERRGPASHSTGGNTESRMTGSAGGCAVAQGGRPKVNVAATTGTAGSGGGRVSGSKRSGTSVSTSETLSNGPAAAVGPRLLAGASTHMTEEGYDAADAGARLQYLQRVLASSQQGLMPYRALPSAMSPPKYGPRPTQVKPLDQPLTSWTCRVMARMAQLLPGAGPSRELDLYGVCCDVQPDLAVRLPRIMAVSDFRLRKDIPVHTMQHKPIVMWLSPDTQPPQVAALRELARIKLGLVLQLNVEFDFVMSPQDLDGALVLVGVMIKHMQAQDQAQGLALNPQLQPLQQL